MVSFLFPPSSFDYSFDDNVDNEVVYRWAYVSSKYLQVSQ